ncbi:cytochrome P450 6k1-like isoform X2 [Harmonia axyridis]|uniref:cytochrome P450 6k1-like isoform X2 n=1 Tax=Harmonia axyridis TaxID=115357 RepID=UPI001E27754A|nr:cytochrome P450 6k1-like isoform X2 [Harmonia axyridis]
MVYMMLSLILFIVAASLIYFYVKRSLSYWKKKNVYAEQPYPLFGNLLNVAFRGESMMNIIKRINNGLSDKHKYFGFYLFHKPVLIVTDKELIKEVLIKDFNTFANRANYTNEKVDPIASNNLFSLRDQVWKTVRNKLSPVFTSGKMKLMMPLMTEISDNLEDVLNNTHNTNIDVKDITKRYAIDITTSCAFGFDSESLKDASSEVKLMSDKLLNPTSFISRFGMFCWVLCPFLVDIFRVPFVDREASRYFINLFKQSEDERIKRNIQRNDFVDLMIEMTKQEKQNDVFQFDDIKKSAQAIVFFNAGTEASSTISSFCLYELALHPEIQQELSNEIRDNLDSNGNISYETLFGMEYLDMVLKETLRKYPFAQFISRYAEKDHIFESTGLKIEEGTQIIIPTLAIHENPKHYPDPSKFDPERFRGDKMKDLQYVYLPFGEGPRKCIGERFALMAMKLVIVTFLKKFELVPGEKTDIPLKFVKNGFFTSTKDGCIYLKIKERRQ